MRDFCLGHASSFCASLNDFSITQSLVLATNSFFFSIVVRSYKGRFIPFEDDAQRADKYFIPLFDVLHNDDFDMRNSIVELESSWCIIIIVITIDSSGNFSVHSFYSSVKLSNSVLVTTSSSISAAVSVLVSLSLMRKKSLQMGRQLVQLLEGLSP